MVTLIQTELTFFDKLLQALAVGFVLGILYAYSKTSGVTAADQAIDSAFSGIEPENGDDSSGDEDDAWSEFKQMLVGLLFLIAAIYLGIQVYNFFYGVSSFSPDDVQTVKILMYNVSELYRLAMNVDNKPMEPERLKTLAYTIKQSLTVLTGKVGIRTSLAATELEWLTSLFSSLFEQMELKGISLDDVNNGLGTKKIWLTDISAAQPIPDAPTPTATTNLEETNVS